MNGHVGMDGWIHIWMYLSETSHQIKLLKNKVK